MKWNYHEIMASLQISERERRRYYTASQRNQYIITFKFRNTLSAATDT